MGLGPTLRGSCVLSANEEPEQLLVADITATGAFLMCRRLRSSGRVLVVRLQPEGCEARVELRALVTRVVDLTGPEPGMAILWLEARSRSAQSLQHVLRSVIGLADGPDDATEYAFVAAQRLMGTLREDKAFGAQTRGAAPPPGSSPSLHAGAIRPPPPIEEDAVPAKRRQRPPSLTPSRTPLPMPAPAAVEPKPQWSLVKKLLSITGRQNARREEAAKLGALAVSPDGRYYNPALDLQPGTTGDEGADEADVERKP